MQENTQKIDHGYDPLLIAAVFALTVIGFGITSSALFGQASTQTSLIVTNKMIHKQMFAFIVGLSFFLIVISSRWSMLYKTEKRVNRIITISTIIGWLSLLGLFVFGHRSGGAIRWYRFGPVSFQPGEFFKVLFIIYIAYKLGRIKEYLATSSIYIIKPMIFLIFIDFTLLVLPDRGSMIQISGLVMIMTVTAMIKKKHILIAGSGIAVMFAIAVIRSSNLMARIMSYLSPELFAKGSAYQTIKSSTMVTMGGLFGAGLGKGTLGGLHWLPEQYNDYIVSVLIEDLGLAGLLAVISLYLIILWRSTQLALNLKSPAQRYAAFGLGMLIISQANINIGVALNMIPTKGAILPFISHGGSAMISFMLAIGGIEWLHRYAPRVDE